MLLILTKVLHEEGLGTLLSSVTQVTALHCVQDLWFSFWPIKLLERVSVREKDPRGHLWIGRVLQATPLHGIKNGL